jgi:hypothetical protein
MRLWIALGRPPREREAARGVHRELAEAQEARCVEQLRRARWPAASRVQRAHEDASCPRAGPSPSTPLCRCAAAVDPISVSSSAGSMPCVGATSTERRSAAGPPEGHADLSLLGPVATAVPSSAIPTCAGATPLGSAAREPNAPGGVADAQEHPLVALRR